MTIMFHGKAIEVEGTHTSRNCKPVVCLTDVRIFASVTDCANAYGVDISSITGAMTGKSKTAANGKEFCLLSEYASHIGKLSNAVQTYRAKATKYDAIIAQQERIRKAHETHELRKAKYLKAWHEFEQAKKLLEESEAEVKALMRK